MMEGSFGAAEGKDGGFEAVAVVAMAMTMKSNDNDQLQWFWSSVCRGFRSEGAHSGARELPIVSRFYSRYPA